MVEMIDVRMYVWSRNHIPMYTSLRPSLDVWLFNRYKGVKGRCISYTYCLAQNAVEVCRQPVQQ